MYDNSIHKGPQPMSQQHHIEVAHSMANQINEFPLDQQNEVLLVLFKSVKERRKYEAADLGLQSASINERMEAIKNFNDRLQKEMEQLRVSE